MTGSRPERKASAPGPSRRALLRALLGAGAVAGLTVPHPAQALVMGALRLLVPGGQGGGWDTAARIVGQGLLDEGLVARLHYENYSGGWGMRALIHLIAQGRPDMMMVQSQSLILTGLTGDFRLTFRDVLPLATVMREYQILVVERDSPFTAARAFFDHQRQNPAHTPVGGGSARWGLDHVCAGLMVEAAGGNPAALRYIPHDAGTEALNALLAGETAALVTGIAETRQAVLGGRVRVLGVTSPERLWGYDWPTLFEQGIPMTFQNWRGFFAAPSVSADARDRLTRVLTLLTTHAAWTRTCERMGWLPSLTVGDGMGAALEAEEARMKTALDRLGFRKG